MFRAQSGFHELYRRAASLGLAVVLSERPNSVSARSGVSFATFSATSASRGTAAKSIFPSSVSFLLDPRLLQVAVDFAAPGGSPGREADRQASSVGFVLELSEEMFGDRLERVTPALGSHHPSLCLFLRTVGGRPLRPRCVSLHSRLEIVVSDLGELLNDDALGVTPYVSGVSLTLALKAERSACGTAYDVSPWDHASTPPPSLLR